MTSIGDDFITWFGHWTKMSPKCHALLTTGGHRSDFVQQVCCVLMGPTDACWMRHVGCSLLCVPNSTTAWCHFKFTKQTIEVLFYFPVCFRPKASLSIFTKFRAIPVKHARLPPWNTHRYHRGHPLITDRGRDKMSSRADKGWGSDEKPQVRKEERVACAECVCVCPFKSWSVLLGGTGRGGGGVGWLHWNSPL